MDSPASITNDASNMEQYAQRLRVAACKTRTVIGHGSAVTTICTIVNNSNADLQVMGAHGHRGLKELLRGSTVDAMRHRVNVPVLVVK